MSREDYKLQWTARLCCIITTITIIRMVLESRDVRALAVYLSLAWVAIPLTQGEDHSVSRPLHTNYIMFEAPHT